jgi:protein transport protein SEC24
MGILSMQVQVCADLFLTSQNYLDIASLSVVPRTTGGQIYFYHGFQSSVDSAKLYNDLRWNLTRPQGLEAIMRVRCSKASPFLLLLFTPAVF